MTMVSRRRAQGGRSVVPEPRGKPSRPSRATDHQSELRELMHAARLAAFLGEPSPEEEGVTQAAGSDLHRLIAEAAAVYRRSINEDTRATYLRRWRLFEAWCNTRGLRALPCKPETLMIYL